MSNYDEEERNARNDYFEENNEPDEPVVKKPKAPKLKPDDPLYWEQQESEWEHLKPRKDIRAWLWIAAVGLAIGIITGVYFRLFTPYVMHASKVGYVENIEVHGQIFHTYEGVILPFKELMDTTRVYKEDFPFSTRNSSIAAKLRRMELSNRPVRVEYSVYRVALPWNGNQKVVITACDTVSPSSILPPEYTPEMFKESGK